MPEFVPDAFEERRVATCDCVHFVFEGSGFKASIIRAVAAGILLVSGRRSKVHNHDSVNDALNECEHLSAPIAAILRKAKDRGLLGDPSPGVAANGRTREYASALEQPCAPGEIQPNGSKNEPTAATRARFRR